MLCRILWEMVSIDLETAVLSFPVLIKIVSVDGASQLHSCYLLLGNGKFNLQEIVKNEHVNISLWHHLLSKQEGCEKFLSSYKLWKSKVWKTCQGLITFCSFIVSGYCMLPANNGTRRHWDVYKGLTWGSWPQHYASLCGFHMDVHDSSIMTVGNTYYPLTQYAIKLNISLSWAPVCDEWESKGQTANYFEQINIF